MPGTRVRVAGPHGALGRRLAEQNRPSVWIAGGIGITPFYQAVTERRIRENTGYEDYLFYATSDVDPLFHPVLASETKKAGIHYYYRQTQRDGRLSPEYLRSQLSQPPSTYTYFLCGPEGLLDAMTSALRHMGIPKSQIVSEAYDFKSLTWS
jgi:predicted ferric reductase